MARAAFVVLALAAAGAAAWPFESTAKGGLQLNATKLPAYLTGNNTALFKDGLAQAKEKLNATGLFNTSVNLPDPKAAVIGAVGGVASLGSIKLLSATAASNTQPVGRVVCYSDWRSGVVTGVAVNDDPTTCGSGDTETPVLLAAQDYISDVDVALVKGTKLIGRLTFTVKNAAGQPTRYVSCGRVPDSWLGKLMTKTTPAVRGKGANGRLSGIKASCLPTGPLTVPPFYLPPILEETATPGDPRIGVIDSIDEPPLDTPLDPGTFIFEFTPRTCKAYVFCVAGSAITTYDAGCDPANPGDNMFFVDAVTGVALPSIACPGPGVDIPEIVIEVPPTQDFSCWAFNNCTVIPPPTLPNDPPPDPIVVPVNTPIPSPPPPAPTPPPAPPVNNQTVPGQRVVIEGGTCTFDNGTPGTCLPAGSSCPAGSLAVAGDRNGKCPNSGVCCAPATSLCRCGNNSNKDENCGFYSAKDQGLSCMCVPTETSPKDYNCGAGCVENGCNSVIGGRSYMCAVTCRPICHAGIPIPGNAQCTPARG